MESKLLNSPIQNLHSNDKLYLISKVTNLKETVC